MDCHLPLDLWHLIIKFSKYNRSLLLLSKSFYDIYIQSWNEDIYVPLMLSMRNHILKNKNDVHPCDFWEKQKKIIY
jgi:hypothetical protein